MKKYGVLLFIGAFFLLGSVPLVRAQEESSSRSKGWKSFFSSDSSKDGHKKKKSWWFSGDEEQVSTLEGVVDLIDTPTTRIVDYGDFRINFRFYRDGGVLNHLSFGVFRRLNLGISWDVEKFMGVDDPNMNAPTLNVKVRAYDGGRLLPSVAFGYDGQGRFFDKAKDLYKERERGLYVVLGRELWVHGLEGRVGGNVSKFKDDSGSEGTVFGFSGLSYSMENKFVLMAEYDNLRAAPLNRLNIGFRIFPFNSLGIDFAVRNVITPSDRERIVRINYVSSF